jgi:flagellar basal-body rod modification protein FlgD
MQVSALSPYTSAGLTNSGTTATTTAKKTTLDQSDFLKLLAKQFQTQDPMKPMEDTSFIAQMAQFTSLQQTSTMSQDISKLLADQNAATANSYIGRSVTVDIGDGTTQSGNVTAIDARSGSPLLVIDGKNYDLSAVLRVEPGVVPPTTPQPGATATGGA